MCTHVYTYIHTYIYIYIYVQAPAGGLRALRGRGPEYVCVYIYI